jgi:hypothetical protein
VRLFTFWSFAPLTYIEHLCLKSMLAAGHPVDLYTYDENLLAPEGVSVRDAAEIMPRDRVLFHKRGNSPALFSDLFRYAGLERNLGTWVDADVLMLRSIADMGDYIFGWEHDRQINGAILKLPADSALFAYVEKLAKSRVPFPSYWGPRKRIKQLLRACVGMQRTIERLDWGAVGPRALTHYALTSGLAELAQPVEVFYPIPTQDAAIAFDPDAKVESRLSSETRTVHLWNFLIREHKRCPPPPGSYIARMCERHGVDCSRPAPMAA